MAISKLGQLEALLFAAGDPLSLDRIASALHRPIKRRIGALH